ncbi:MAG: TonB-dependent receptor [Balneolaceae bacterium]
MLINYIINSLKEKCRIGFIFISGLLLFTSATDMNAQVAQNTDTTKDEGILVQMLVSQKTTNEKRLITMEVADLQLADALDLLAEKLRVGISFNSEIMPDKKVSLDMKNASVYEVLHKLLEDTNLEPLLPPSRDVIVIREKKQEESEVLQEVVTGIVTDENGESLPGVTIVVQGTQNGVTTDFDGNYSITVPEDGVLLFSYIGYDTHEETVGGRSTIDVALEPSITDLGELVVVGYGMQRKALVTGATSNIQSADVQKLRTTSAVQALQGQTPGMQIISESGQPGKGMKVVIRGLGTIGNSDPLYIVDGVQVSNINHINPNDIENVDVLKDAASAAIYGSQASNGVVLVTTKTGSVGAPTVTYDSYVGVHTVANHIETLNTPQYMMIMNEAAENSGATSYFSEEEIASANEGIDWVREMYYDRPITQNHTFGIRGGTEVSTYSISLGYTGEEGIVGGPEVSSYDRYNFRLNTDHNLNDYISIGQRLNFDYREQKGIQDGHQYGNRFRDAIQANPLLPMYDDEGNWFNNVDGTIVNGEPWEVWYPDDFNPKARMILEDNTNFNYQDIVASIYADINPREDFNFRSSFGVEYNVEESRRYRPEFYLSWERLNERPQASQAMDKGYSWILDGVATYNKVLGVGHDISLMAGVEAQASGIGSSFNASNTNLIMSGYEYAWVTNATNSDQSYMSFNAGPMTENRLLSYFSRAGYNLHERYLVNATFRIDGSSRFSGEERWGYFPSISLGWIMSDEPFMEDTAEWLTFFKPRVSWGQVGNQRVAPYQYMSPVSIDGADNNAYFGSELSTMSSSVGGHASRLSNPNLKWETSEQLNVGIDAYMLADRLGLVFDWYRKTTKDWIITPPVLATVGTGAPAINGGNVKNQGIELGLTWRDQIGTDFSYNIGLNFNTNKNEVLSVPTPDGIIHGVSNRLYHNNSAHYRQAEVGKPIGYFWGWETNGIFQNEQEVLDYVNSEGQVIQPNAKPGDLRYVDQDDSGSIGTDDKVQIGNPWPKYLFGFTTRFDYKRLDFSLTASGVAGNDIIQVYRNFARARPNYPVSILDRWHGEGTSNTVPRVTEQNVNHEISDYLLHKGDYLRINNLTIGYDFSSLISPLNGLRIYGSINNVYTFTGYSGSDPEIGYSPSSSSAGTDVGYYPRPRTFMIGLELEI